MKLACRLSIGVSVRVCIYIASFLLYGSMSRLFLWVEIDMTSYLYVDGRLTNIGQSLARIVRVRVEWKVPWIGVMSLMRPSQRLYLQA